MVLIACYLNNCPPTSLLNGKSPHQLLFPDRSPFPLSPRVFGCVGHVHNMSPNIDKLDPRAHKCIFLGYS